MNDLIPEDQERKLSERFESGERLGNTDTERDVFRAYQYSQEKMRTVALPSFDTNALARKMEREIKKNRLRIFRIDWRHVKMLKPALAPAMVLCVMIGWLGIGYANNPIEEAVTGQDIFTSWIWKQKFIRGRTVTIPSGLNVTLKLKDHSVITCSKNTKLAVTFDENRCIALERGRIHIQAAKDTKHPMIVETPLGYVRVMGTTFTVEICP